MSKLVIAAIGPASSVQDGGRPGAQRYGLVPSGAMDRLALAAANTLVGNGPFAAAVEVGPFGAKFTARGGAVRVALAGAPRNADIAGRPVASDTSATLADGETLTLGFARGGSFSYLAIEGGIAGEPMFGSLAVNARAGLGSPYPRPLQAGDELQTQGRQRRARAADRTAGGHRRADPRGAGVRRTTSSPTRPRNCLLDSEWKISATSDRMGYRLEGPVLKHLHGHNIVSDGTVNGSLQVPGNGQPIVLMPRPRHQRRLSQDRDRDLSRLRAACADPAGRCLSLSGPSAWRKRRRKRANSQSCCAPCPSGCGHIESVDLNIDALHDANVAGHAVSAVDAGTWHAVALADTSGPGLINQSTQREADKHHEQPSTSIAISAKDLARGKWAMTPR